MNDQAFVPTIDAFRMPLDHRSDVAGLERLMSERRLKPDDVIAVTGVTEGWEPNDTSRLDADRAVRAFFVDHGSRSADHVAQIPMVFTTGGMGILSPHIVVFTRSYAPPATDGIARLALGVARSETILPEWMATTRLVEANADVVRMAAGDAKIDPDNIEFVVGKTFFPAKQALADARAAGHDIPGWDDVTLFRKSSGAAGLAVAVAGGRMPMPLPEEVGNRLELYAAKVAVQCNPWKEIGGIGAHTQLMAFGNKAGAGGRLRIGQAVMADALDIGALSTALRQAGLDAGPGPLSPEQSSRIVAVYIKLGLPTEGRLRGRRQIIDNPEYRNQVKAAVGGMLASVLQDNMIWMSLPNPHQGPPGGGNLAVIIDAG